jgi:hypothetical protein
MEGPLRVLVVDGSRLMPWLVGAVAPENVLVDHAGSFQEARDILASNPPHVAIFNLTPVHLPWQELARTCREHRPPIPFRCFCSVCADEKGPPGDPPMCPHVVEKPSILRGLRNEVEALLREAHEAAENPELPITACGDHCPGRS